MLDKSISIVIPAYNEALTIQAVIEAFAKFLPQATYIVINNASTDETESLAKQTLKRLSLKGSVLNESRPGKAMAIRRAFELVTTDVAVMVDADMTYPADKVHDLIQPIIEDQADMVIGNRHADDVYKKQNKRLFHHFGNHLVAFLISVLFKGKVLDILSGYRAFSLSFIKNFPIMSQGFQLETEMTLHAMDKRYRIKEIPISYFERPEGSFSKLSTTFDGVRVIRFIFSLFRHYRPFLFFSLLSVAIASLGFFVGVPVILEFQATGLISKQPSAILASSLEIIAIFTFLTGVILDTIVQQHHQNYEQFRLNMDPKKL